MTAIGICRIPDGGFTLPEHQALSQAVMRMTMTLIGKAMTTIAGATVVTVSRSTILRRTRATSSSTRDRLQSTTASILRKLGVSTSKISLAQGRTCWNRPIHHRLVAHRLVHSRAGTRSDLSGPLRCLRPCQCVRGTARFRCGHVRTHTRSRRDLARLCQ